MRRKVKAFSAPPFVLKAVMAGQVGKYHALSLVMMIQGCALAEARCLRGDLYNWSP